MTATEAMVNWQSETEAALKSIGLEWHNSADLVPHMNIMRTALDGLAQADTQVSSLLADDQYSAQSREDKSDAIRNAAAEKAQAALNDLLNAANAVAEKVRGQWTPPKPTKAADTALMLDRKADLIRLLDSQQGDILEAAGKLFEQAMKQGDDDSLLTAHVLAGGAMNLYYQAKGVNLDLAPLVFAAASGQSAAFRTLTRTPHDAPGGGGRQQGALGDFISAAQSEMRRLQATTKSRVDNAVQDRLGMERSRQTFSW